MMSITCPLCGPRDESEFRCGGAANVERPGPPETVDDQLWSDFLFRHDEVAGWQAERWEHTFGCRAWFNVWRHTVTHELGEPTLMGQPMTDLKIKTPEPTK